MAGLALLLIAAALQQPAAGPDSTRDSLAGAVPPPLMLATAHRFPRFAVTPAATADTGRRRAVEHGDGYYTRLSIHRYASYATLPLVVTEFFLGQSLYDHPGEEGSTKSAHSIVAGGIGVLFGVNTVTGVWNLWDSRHDPDGKTRRYVHALSMIAADAGFAWAASIAPSDDDATPELQQERSRHRTVALGSMAISLASYGMMLLWKD